jgi:DNA modification methylase
MPDDYADLPQPAFEGTVPVDDLEVDGDNPNEMTDDQFGLLCDRMRTNGWLGGPVVTDTDGLIADGEHRWRAAQEIGLSEVPVKQFDIDDATRRLWRQELNKIHGEHDDKRDALEYDLLLDSGKSDEVHELTQAADEDLDELLDEIKMDAAAPVEYEYDPDHNVYFEDCVEGMRERLDDDSVDMVFTSPPYNKSLDHDRTEQWSGDSTERVYYEDNKDWDEYTDWMETVLEEISRVLKPSGHLFFNVEVDITDGVITPPYWAVEACPLPWRSQIIWSKGVLPPTASNMHNSGRFQQTWEPILHFSKEPEPLNETEAFAVWDVLPSNFEHSHDTEEHPAPYPIKLVDKAIQPTTEKGDTVLDPFMGSGTTAVAAIESGRDYVGFELDEEGAYKPIIERRIGEAKRQVEANQRDA